MTNPGKVRVGIVGATGYSGQELMRIIMGHPGAQLTYLAATTDSGAASELLPQFHGGGLPTIEAYHADRCADSCEVVFVALPSGASGSVTTGLWERGLRVIDLSGDLRLSSSDYQEWYGQTAVSESYLNAAVYGLSEWNGDSISKASLIANPGCYATAVLLGLLPLAQAGLLAGRQVTVDAKSGVSGAGRAPKLANQLAQLADNFFPYKVGRHQHTPEIEQQLGGGTRILLNTQLLPVARGIYMCAYVPWGEGMPEDEILGLYQASYENTPFVSVLPTGMVPELKSVRGSNSCHIQVVSDSRTDTLMVFAVLDNLQKGAAGQAVQNFNLMHGYEETTGLSVYGLVP